MKPAPKMIVQIPVRDVPTRRAPGRPRRVEFAPSATEANYRSWTQRQLAEFIRSDTLKQQLDEALDPGAVLDQVIHEAAIESARLAWDRERAVAEGRRDAEQVCSRRVHALAGLAKLIELRDELQPDAPNPAHIATAKQLFLDAIRCAAEESLPADLATVLGEAVQRRLAAL